MTNLLTFREFRFPSQQLKMYAYDSDSFHERCKLRSANYGALFYLHDGSKLRNPCKHLLLCVAVGRRSLDIVTVYDMTQKRRDAGVSIARIAASRRSTLRSVCRRLRSIRMLPCNAQLRMLQEQGVEGVDIEHKSTAPFCENGRRREPRAWSTARERRQCNQLIHDRLRRRTGVGPWDRRSSHRDRAGLTGRNEYCSAR